jgi:putative FmdB family regulatory protein
MPTYEYQCKTCGHHFERVQRFSDDPITECPTCGGVVKRVIHPAGVIFKGSGWYITDSRKGGESASLNTASAATKTEGEATKTESTPAESKPAEKAASVSDS